MNPKITRIFKQLDKLNLSIPELVENLFICQEILDVENLEIPTKYLKDIKRLETYNLDIGGQSITARRIDEVGQELASLGLIGNFENYNELEDQLTSLYNQNQKIKESKKEALDYVNQVTSQLFDKVKLMDVKDLLLTFVYLLKITFLKSFFVYFIQKKTIKTKLRVNKIKTKYKGFLYYLVNLFELNFKIQI